MTANQSQWPREWLMTDERLGARLWDAVEALPSGAGIVFRHYATSAEEREALGRRLAKTCLDRGLTFAVAGNVGLAASLGADLVHNPGTDPRSLPYSRSAHSRDEAEEGWVPGAALIFLSPIYETHSHQGRVPLSREEARRIVAASPVPVIALGGMNRERFEERRSDGFYGWAGIDAWLGGARSSRE